LHKFDLTFILHLTNTIFMNETPSESTENEEMPVHIAFLDKIGALEVLARIFPSLEQWLDSPEAQSAIAAMDEAPDVAHSSEFFTGPNLEAQTKDEIYIFGDSIAEGVASHFPHGQGLRGYTTSRLLDTLTTLISSGELANCKSLVLFCGGNDINGEVPLDTSIQNIRQMVAALKEIGVQPVLSNKYITDQYNGVEGTQEVAIIQEFNAAVLALGQEQGVPVIDVGRKYPDPSGVHDSSRYRGIASEIEEELNVGTV
jgi:lysophospholipase L1-like esterase